MRVSVTLPGPSTEMVVDSAVDETEKGIAHGKNGDVMFRHPSHLSVGASEEEECSPTKVSGDSASVSASSRNLHDNFRSSRATSISFAVIVNTTYACLAALLLIHIEPASAYLASCGPAYHRRTLCYASPSPMSLEDYTVKELRDLVKEVSAERGTLSKLKRKQDLVNFLRAHESSSVKKSPSQMAPLSEASTIQREEGSPVINTADAADLTPTTTFSSPKEAIFERVYQRYPVLRHSATNLQSTNTVAYRADDIELDESSDTDSNNMEQDIRQWQHPIYSHYNKTSADMDVIFVGTASCAPSITRGVSCTALRLLNGGGGTWLFDVGECTQLQIQKSINIRPGKISKIFLTHAHGDHTFGLPGLLCLMGEAYNRDVPSPPVDVYGPEGLRMWLRVAIRYSVSRIVPPYRVHELMDLPMAPEWEFSSRTRRFYYRRRPATERPIWGSQGLAGQDPSSWISQANRMPLQPSSLYGEVDGGRDIYPQYNHPLSADGAPVYEVEEDDDVKVYAAPMSHGIPCVGYAVHEHSRPGRLRDDLVDPIVQRNLDALRDAGFRIPLKAKAVIKDLPEGASFKFPDGTVVRQEDAVEPKREGRRVVFCGDTCDSRAMSKLAYDADLIVHEATNAYLPGLETKETDARSVTRDAILHGHSTPVLAARFAKAVHAKRLVLNHFSSRYKGDTSVESLSIMQRIEEQAVRQVPGWNETHVAAAWDLMVLPVPPH